jgi:hypothetical protein
MIRNHLINPVYLATLFLTLPRLDLCTQTPKQDGTDLSLTFRSPFKKLDVQGSGRNLLFFRKPRKPEHAGFGSHRTIVRNNRRYALGYHSSKRTSMPVPSSAFLNTAVSCPL